MFGERESSLPIAGYVPALERSRQLRPIESQSDAAADLAAKTLEKIESQRKDEEQQRAQGTFKSTREQTEDIHGAVVVRKAVRKVRDQDMPCLQTPPLPVLWRVTRLRL